MTQQEADTILGPLDSAATAIAAARSAVLALVDGEPPPPPPPPPPTGDTLGPGLVEYEEIHVHEGQTLTILPGTELRRIDVPPADPTHGDGGIVNHGTLIAVREPTEAPILFTSANPSGHRGHLMSHGVMQLRGVEIRDMGRTTISAISATNPLARYACHWHMAGDQPTSFVEDCLIHDTVEPSIYRHGIVIHGTNQVTVRGNTIRNKGGTGIFTEDGSERDNLIEGNLCEWIRNRHGLNSHLNVPPRPVEIPPYKNDFGFEGAGYWFRGPLNIVRNNTARFCGVGYEFYQDQLSFPAYQQYQFAPMNVFADNLAEDCHDGFAPWFVGADSTHDHANATIGPRQYMDRFTARRCKRGVFSYYLGRVTARDFILEDCHTGWTGGDYRHWECEIVRPTITGSTYAGIDVSTYINNGLLVVDGTFNNVVDVHLRVLWHNGNGAVLPPRLVRLRNCLFGGQTHVKMFGLDTGMRNYVQLDQTFVEDYQRVVGDSFQVFFDDQRGDFPLPQTSNGGKVVGCPVAGLTNQEAWDQHGVTFAGELLPAGATVRPGIIGKVSV